MTTPQLELWQSQFGRDYAERNHITADGQRRLMRDWGTMLKHAVTPKPQSVLEVGCNIGRNLLTLQNFVEQVSGIEPNSDVVANARSNPSLASVDIQTGDGFNIDREDECVDLVFTSGVLIHVAPDDLGGMVDEIVRVARHYVLCIEYFSHEPVEIKYRGRDGFLFKRDFGAFYLERHPTLRVLDHGFLWKPIDSGDNSNWWLFVKR